MRLIDSFLVFDGKQERRIGLYEGDLSRIPADQAVDILVVSAFPNDYTPLQGTVIGALDQRGLSVDALSANKHHDLRSSCGFWLSHRLKQDYPDFNIDRILCFEPHSLGQPPEVVGDLFRGLFPFLDDKNDASVALPLISGGNAGWPAELIFAPLLEAAYEWLSRGLAIRELKIVEKSAEKTARLATLFRRFKASHSVPRAPVSTIPESARPYDVFLSYSSHDADAATLVNAALKTAGAGVKVFDFKSSIDKGKSWQQEIDDAIESCRRIIAVLSQPYFESVECNEELMIARLRHKRSHGEVLFPIYWNSLDKDLALWLQIINYSDCRERDTGQVAKSVGKFARKHLL